MSYDSSSIANSDCVINSNKLNFGFEFFPWKSMHEMGQTEAEKGLARQCKRIDENESVEFVSVTSGASGSDKRRTSGFVQILKKYLCKPLLVHVSCSNVGKLAVMKMIENYIELGVHSFLIVTGDHDASVCQSPMQR